jgi:DNA polymerase
MRILVLDFETYYCSKTYTLKKLTTEGYIRDPRFEALLLDVHDPVKKEGGFLPKPLIQEWCDEQDWSNTGVICHHAQFDCGILNHHYGVKPAFIFDTISMARIAYGPCEPLSLANLAKKLGLGTKSIDYSLFDGKRYHELSDTTIQRLGTNNDCELTFAVFKACLPLVPRFELDLIDKAIRMFTEPLLVGDIEMLTAICKEEAERKTSILDSIGVSEKDLASTPKFQKILESFGIEVEFKDGKVNEKTGIAKRTPCFAKTDEFMQELCDHENELISALAEARLGVRSTIKSTRAGRLLTMAERGPLCNYTHHAGAHTLRGTGGDKANFRNLPRGSQLRLAVRAPEGYKLSIKDAKQIELRSLLWLAGDGEKLAFLEAGGDSYCEMASDIFGEPVTKQEIERRHIGKETKLGCGYGMGAAKFEKYVNGKNIIIKQPDGTKRRLLIDEELAQRAVSVYRQKHPLVRALWREAEKVMMRLANGESFEWKCFTIRDKKVYSPTGSYMHYSSLQFGLMYPDSAEPEWFMYPKRNRKSKMYGAKFVENLNQFLARCIVAEAALRCSKTFPLVLETYDELVHLVPIKGENKISAQGYHERLMADCEIRPSWAQDLPIEMEGGIYERYEK